MNNLFKKVVSSVALVAMLAALIPTASFAATISDGDLVKAAGSSAIYLIQDGKKRVFPHSSVYLSWGYPANYSTVKTVTAEELAAYAEGDAVIYRDGFMFRFKGVGMTGGFDPSAVFFVSDGKVRPIESASAYMKLFNGGVNESSAWDRVYWIPDDLLAKFTYPQGSNITSAQIDAGQLPNGLVVRDSNSLYYVVNNGQLSNVSSTGLSANRYTANSNVFSKMLVTKLANSVLNLMPAGAAITTADTSLLTVKKLTVTPSATNVILSSDKTSVEADGASYATLTATVPSTVTSVTFAITSGSGMLSSYSVTPVAGVATVRVTPSAASVSGTLTVSASATGLTSASVTVTTVANTLAPQVVSVSNQGMRLVNVVFDKAIDKSTAETTPSSNFILKNNKGTTVTVESSKLLDDGKTVQLKLASGFFNDSLEDSIEVKNMKNVAQTATMSTVTKLMTVTDVASHSVVAVEALGSRAIRVTFSEAVSLNGYGFDKSYGYGNSSFRLDDKELVTATTGLTANQIGGVTITYPDANDYTKALISFANPVSVGAHTLMVSYNGLIKDYNTTTSAVDAGNYNVMQPAGYVATFVADTSSLALSSVEVLSQTKVRYTFSKAIATPKVDAFFYSTSANVNSGSTANGSVTKVSDSVYEVTWTSAIPTGTVYFYAGGITAGTDDDVVDYSGNMISPLPSSRSLVVASDTAPTISSVAMDTDSDKKVVVTFSKDVENTSAIVQSNYVFKSSNGTVLTSTTGGSGIGANGNPLSIPAKVDDKKYTITLTESLPGGTYQLCITNVKALSGSSTSAMPTSCYSFTVTDKTRPTLKDNGGAFTTTGTTANVFAADAGSSYAGRIIVKYSEPMGSSAIDAKNYKGYGFTGYDTWTKLSEISGVTLSFRNSNKDVVIDFPNSIDLDTTTYLMIGYIDGSNAYAPTDANGNLLRDTTNTENVSVTGTLSTVKTAGLNVGYGYGYGTSDSAYGYGITSLKIKSATTFEAIFARPMETVSPSEFTYDNTATSGYQPVSGAVICNAANYANSASTGCDEENEAKVIFTIPAGPSYEFAANDTTFTVKTIASPSSTKDTLGLLIVGGATSGVTSTNGIRPTMKSWVFNSPTQITVAFDGKIESNDGAGDSMADNNNQQSLGYGLILTQTVGATTTTASGTEIVGVVTAADSTTVKFNLSKSFDINSSATLKTVSDGSIIAVGANSARVAANTAGMTNATFVASSINVISGYGYGSYSAPSYGYGTNVIITFNSNVKISSLISGWTNAKESKTVNSSFVVASDGTITFSGVTLGQLKTNKTGANVSYNASYIFTDTTAAIQTLMISVDSTASDTGMALTSSNTVTFEPSSSVQNTDGYALETSFKPAK